MFCEIIINTWDDALLLFDEISRKIPIWAFRGQSNHKWGLSTKFEREAKKYNCCSYFFKNREKAILRDFQRKAHHYVQNLPNQQNYIEWLSLIQHYGGPTRLLDFTYSYYVAAFFAMESSTIDSAIWAVNINKLLKHVSKLTKIKETERGYEDIIDLHIHMADTVIKNRKDSNIVFVVEPFQQHERISIQQGLFLFPGNIEKSFEHNLCSVFELKFSTLLSKNSKKLEISDFTNVDTSDISVMKIVIPYSLHSKALTDLNKMNVTSTTLFPGLDGFARSLSFHFTNLEYLLNR